MKKIKVIILGGNDDITLYTIRSLSRSQNILEIHLISDSFQNVSKYSRHIKSFHVLESELENRKLKKLIKIIYKTKANLLFPISVLFRSFISNNIETLLQIISIIPLPKPGDIALFDNKENAFEFFKKNNIPTPKTEKANLIKIEQDNLKTKYPQILKPKFGTNGEGVSIHTQKDSLLEMLNEDDFQENDFLIQEYIDGFMVGGNALCQNGEVKAYTTSKWIFPSSVGFSYPKAHIYRNYEEVKHIIEKIVKITNWNGIFNIDCIIRNKDSKLFVLEINPRYGMSTFGSTQAGINFSYLDCLLGLNVKFAKSDFKKSVFMFSKIGMIQKMKEIFFKKEKIKFSFLENTSFTYEIMDIVPEFIRLLQ